MPYIGVSPFNGVRKKHTYTATASQTSFSGAGTEGITLSYKDSTFVDVFQNGVKLGEADYTSTSGTAIVLAQGASLNDLIEVVVYDVFSVADTVSKADGGTFDNNVSVNGTVEINSTTTNDFLVVKTTEAGSGSAPDIVFARDSSSPADNDFLGKIVFRGKNDASEDVEYAQIASQLIDASDGTEDGKLYLQTKVNGSDTNVAVIDSSGVTVTGTVIQATNGSASAPNYAITSGSVGVNGMYVDSANELKFASGGAERLKLSSAGIDVTGTTTTDNLTVEGTGVNFTVNQTANNLTATFKGAGLGTMELQGTSSGGFIDIKQGDNDYDVRIGGNNSGGYIANGSAAFAVSGTGSFSFNVSGAVSKSSGSFKISHPLEAKKDTHHLFHSFIEGPQCDNLYRGKVALSNGSATVNLDTKSGMTDGTFVALNRDVQCFTTNETGWTAIKGSVSGNVLTITAQDDSCTDTISWLVIGERQDDEIKASSLTDDDGNLVVEKLKSEAPDANQNYGNVE